jgi:hypothetical protein
MSVFTVLPVFPKSSPHRSSALNAATADAIHARTTAPASGQARPGHLPSHATSGPPIGARRLLLCRCCLPPRCAARQGLSLRCLPLRCPALADKCLLRSTLPLSATRTPRAELSPSSSHRLSVCHLSRACHRVAAAAGHHRHIARTSRAATHPLHSQLATATLACPSAARVCAQRNALPAHVLARPITILPPLACL